MLTRDSIITEPIASPEFSDTMVQRPAKPQTPYQVLRLLPKDATPAQQDSAVQAWFQPGEIHYSSMPDTLHLPGHDKGRDLRKVDLPQYYRENFFSNDTIFHTEVGGGRFGMSGDPVPYTIRNDNLITSLLLVCFVASLIAFSVSGNFFWSQIKKFFYQSKAAERSVTETSPEVKSQLYFLTQTCLLLALLFFLYIRQFVTDSFILSDEYLLVAIFFGIIVGYFLLKYAIYCFVNLVFFDGKRNRQYLLTLLFVHAVEGILLFPAVMLYAFFDLQPQTIIYYFVSVVVLVKMLTFYKGFVIFFKQNGFYLQNILYFCTLEIVPLVALWSGLTVIVNALKIIF